MRSYRPLAFLVFLAALGAALYWGLRPAEGPPISPLSEPESPPWLVDVTDQLELDFVHDAGPVDGRYFMPQALGSGAALFDCDGDGRLDIYLLNNGGPTGRPNQLFRQLANGHFSNISSGSGLDVAGYHMGVAIGDINNDGRPDVLITEFHGVRLFINKGAGVFADVTKEAGLHNPAWGASAAFFDYNRDGWLDLVVVNYVAYDPTWPCTLRNGLPEYCPPSAFPGSASRLYRNKGMARTDSLPGTPEFEDVTASSGLGRVPGPGLGVACADFDGDRWPDIFVANDGKANRLWINQRDGKFVEE